LIFQHLGGHRGIQLLIRLLDANNLLGDLFISEMLRHVMRVLRWGCGGT
jgi:hypothetical protein